MLGERRGIDDRFRVVISIEHHRRIILRVVLPIADQRPGFIFDNVIVKVDECRDLFGSRAVRINNHPAPQITLSESEEIETCDNTEVVSSTFEGLEQVRIGVFVGMDDPSVTEDDLEEYI